jgi:hypothetical protein
LNGAKDVLGKAKVNVWKGEVAWSYLPCYIFLDTKNNRKSWRRRSKMGSSMASRSCSCQIGVWKWTCLRMGNMGQHVCQLQRCGHQCGLCG